MNELLDDNGVKVNIFEAKSKSILQVKVFEKVIVKKRRSLDRENLFCDIKVNGGLVRFEFKIDSVSREMKIDFKNFEKKGYNVKNLGKRIIIFVVEPNYEELSNVFTVMEGYCRKNKKS